jgi:hypothetical protein
MKPHSPSRAPKPWYSQTRWLVAVFILCAAVYLHALRQKDRTYQAATSQLQTLEQEKQAALAQQEDLLSEIHSQSDPAFVEMCLKRNLGLVPEGQTKVYFHKE